MKKVGHFGGSVAKKQQAVQKLLNIFVCVTYVLLNVCVLDDDKPK